MYLTKEEALWRLPPAEFTRIWALTEEGHRGYHGIVIRRERLAALIERFPAAAAAQPDPLLRVALGVDMVVTDPDTGSRYYILESQDLHTPYAVVAPSQGTEET